MPLTRFRKLDGSDEYTFQYLQDGMRDFSNTVPRTHRLPGVPGGFDSFGKLPAPTEIGAPRQAFFIIADTRAEMEALRDRARALSSWGLGRLYMQPTDPNLPERWTYARVNYVNIPLNEHLHTDLWQPASVVWQVADPHWYILGTEAWRWNDGTPWGSAVWGGNPDVITFPGGATSPVEATISVGGTVYTLPRITIVGTDSFDSVVIERVKAGGKVLDTLEHSSGSDGVAPLRINCRKKSVTNNGGPAYDDLTKYHPDWFRLDPGDNIIRVYCENNANDVLFKFYYYEAYL